MHTIPSDSASSVRRPRATSPRLRLLVIDDEPLMLRTLSRMLAPDEVVTVPGGAEAIELLQDEANFDVVVCDLSMPLVDGAMFYEAARHYAPELLDRIIFASGGPFTASTRSFVASVPNTCLLKPFSAPMLRDLIEGFRDGSAGSTGC